MAEWLIGMPEEQATWLARVAIAFVLGLGAIIGSFLNVCIYRIPLGQSVSVPRSHCFGCGRTIPWYLNIPVLSWFILRGKCAYCKSEISVRYPAVEALTAVLFLLVFQMWGNPSLFALRRLQIPELIPFYWLFVASTVVNVMIDFDHRILLDRISLGGTLLTLAASAAFPAMQGQTTLWAGLGHATLGAAVGFGTGFAVAWLGERIFLQDAFGFGDVKWMMLFGALFGWRGFFYILLLAALAGLLMGLCALIANRTRAGLRAAPLAIPFGPALGLGALLWLFWGHWVVRGLETAILWAQARESAVLAIALPLFALLTGWLCVRIHFIRKAIREEERCEVEAREEELREVKARDEETRDDEQHQAP